MSPLTGSHERGAHGAIELIPSPWAARFDELSRLAVGSIMLVSPFVSSEPLARLSSGLKMGQPRDVEILTNLGIDNLAAQSTDPGALALFCEVIPGTRVRHLPGLHAKVYIADDVAVVTSANLTSAGLNRNYEYGVRITDSTLVARIREDLRAYAELGAEVSALELRELAQISRDLHDRQRLVLGSARQTLRKEFERRLESGREALRLLRAKSVSSTSAIFSKTILYLLAKGPLSTEEMHPLVQQIHPDLCDDGIDRVISGVHFGKRWKHLVRSAQQALKGQALIKLEGGKWRLV